MATRWDDDLNRRFDYLPPGPDVQAKIDKVRAAIKTCARSCVTTIDEDSGETQVMLRRLEEALMWGTAAVARAAKDPPNKP